MRLPRLKFRSAGWLVLAAPVAAAAFTWLAPDAPDRLSAPAAAAERTAAAEPAAAVAATRRPPPSLRRHFGVLRRERTAADHLGGRTKGMPESDYVAQQLRALSPAAPARGDAAPPPSDAFVAPATGGGLCLLVIPPGFEGPGGTCVSREEALAGGAVSALDAGGGLSQVVGLVPDGVASVTLEFSSGRVVLPVVHNAYGAMAPGRPLAASYRQRGGRLARIPFGG